MEILINDHQLISEIQEEFNQAFPFLRLEFLLSPGDKEKGIEKKRLMDVNASLSEYRSQHKGGEDIVISKRQKVSELKKLFQKVYGLIVRVFRKIGDIWLETTSTGDWTFEKQNNEAFKMSLIS
jgi:hypothetical protein